VKLKIDTLHPHVKEKARQLIAECKREGINLVVTSGLRTYAEQARLYAQGRSRPGRIVTNAKPGQSWHNHALAFDCVPFVNGKPDWESPHWDRIGALGEQLGLTWGGRFRLVDKPHFQFTNGLTLAEAMRRHTTGEALLA
jgi:peptidoglycan LD-endopeptidase CwlK